MRERGPTLGGPAGTGPPPLPLFLFFKNEAARHKISRGNVCGPNSSGGERAGLSRVPQTATSLASDGGREGEGEQKKERVRKMIYVSLRTPATDKRRRGEAGRKARGSMQGRFPRVLFSFLKETPNELRSPPLSKPIALFYVTGGLFLSFLRRRSHSERGRGRGLTYGGSGFGVNPRSCVIRVLLVARGRLPIAVVGGHFKKFKKKRERKMEKKKHC